MKKRFYLWMGACLLFAVCHAQEASSTQIKALVDDAAAMIQTKGEAAFADLLLPGSPWQQGEHYVFVLDAKGNMLVHPDPALQGKNELDLKDINGKLIIRGLITAATASPEKPEGWYHYEWPVPGGIIPRWKSTFAKQVRAPSGKYYIVCSGDYNDRMEREFVVDMVKDAVAQIEKKGETAYSQFLDPAGPFRAKDAYVFVVDPSGMGIINPAFPSTDGKNQLDQKDMQGKFFIREMLRVAQENGPGWVDYMWPKPGENISTQKSVYVSKARLDKDKWVLVGSGIYLADAPKMVSAERKMTSQDLMRLVREAAVIFEQQGEKAFPEFKVKGSKWFHDDCYFFVWTMDGTRYFHAANPAGEGADMSGFKDVLDRPMGQMTLDVGNSVAGEGWVHYMYPGPGDVFPTWKSSFIKRVKFPSGKEYLIGCGIYNMEMDKNFIEDVVNRAAELVARQGKKAFDRFRDKKGPFLFMDTYVFVNNLKGDELVNPAQPSMEGKNLLDTRDAHGKLAIKEYLDAAVKNGSAWVDYYWYKPGDNAITKKYTFVKAVEYQGTTYVLGAGFYQTDRTREYEFPETRELVLRVDDAADLVRNKGEKAFQDFRTTGSRWREGENYIFVLDPKGNMLVHPDPALEGKNEMDLKDINGKPIIRGLLSAATAFPDKPEGWYHYEWVVPGELFPRWKSSFVKLVEAPSGKSYLVGCGVYNDRMERIFLVDAVMSAVQEIEQRGKAAFPLLHDPAGPYIAKDAYVWVTDMNGVELVNPAFPNMEGKNLLDVTDVSGKFVYRELIDILKAQDDTWIDYMYPKPGESIPTRKSAYVHTAQLGDQTVMVGCGAYLADAPQTPEPVQKMTASQLTNLVREAAVLLEEQGEQAYAAFEQPGTRWFNGETYLFTCDMDGVKTFNAADPADIGQASRNLKDIQGRPFVQMMLDAGNSSFGEGWVHYLYPEPGSMFPAWKSSFVKKVSFPNGRDYLVGSGIYNVQMDKAFIEDLVDRASALIAQQGRNAFDQLRDKKGPFVFMDTYVFVISPDGTELVNPDFPSLEGKNIMDLKDLKGREVVRDEIAAALSEGSAWMEIYWYLPGTNTQALKQTFVRKVEHKGETFIVGSGYYGDEGPALGMGKREIRKMTWNSIEPERLNDKLARQTIFGEKATLVQLSGETGAAAGRHFHPNEEYCWVLSGTLLYRFDDGEIVCKAGDLLVVPPNVPHAITVLEDAVFVDFFSPAREDWLKGEDLYLRSLPK